MAKIDDLQKVLEEFNKKYFVLSLNLLNSDGLNNVALIRHHWSHRTDSGQESYSVRISDFVPSEVFNRENSFLMSS